jgi:hypothetical protein
MFKHHGEIILTFDENATFTGSRILAGTDREQAQLEQILAGIAAQLKERRNIK